MLKTFFIFNQITEKHILTNKVSDLRFKFERGNVFLTLSFAEEDLKFLKTKGKCPLFSQSGQKSG